MATSKVSEPEGGKEHGEKHDARAKRDGAELFLDRRQREIFFCLLADGRVFLIAAFLRTSANGEF